MAITHAKVSAVADGADTTKIRPQADWNANHVIGAGTITDTEVAAANKDGAAGTASMRTLGTGAAQAAAGDHTTPAASTSAAGHMTANQVKQLTAQTDAETTGAITLDFSAGATVEVDTTGNISITLSNGVTGAWHAVVIHYGGAHTVTWTTTVKWENDTEPTWTETNAKTDIAALFYDGTNWYGTASVNFNV